MWKHQIEQKIINSITSQEHECNDFIIPLNEHVLANEWEKKKHHHLHHEILILCTQIYVLFRQLYKTQNKVQFGFEWEKSSFFICDSDSFPFPELFAMKSSEQRREYSRSIQSLENIEEVKAYYVNSILFFFRRNISKNHACNAVLLCSTSAYALLIVLLIGLERSC